MGLSKHWWIPHFRPWHFGVSTIIFTTFLVYFGVPAGFLSWFSRSTHMKPAFLGVIHGYTMSYTISGAQIHTHISFGLSMATPKAKSLLSRPRSCLGAATGVSYFSNAVNILVTKIGWYLWMLIPVKYGSTIRFWHIPRVHLGFLATTSG
jgi:hypothetical protein